MRRRNTGRIDHLDQKGVCLRACIQGGKSEQTESGHCSDEYRSHGKILGEYLEFSFVSNGSSGIYFRIE